ncbi:MAG: D-alanyl-D-alanine carboxypeptidase [Holosporaceae bacterium]|jgi:D-alanyl-D-alanine carboxypeptidase|nr:D-alanyl-D-alanine carboxypeptidase [Holosporaceae bacterium]
MARCCAQPPLAFIVANSKNGNILFSHNCDEKTQPASLTKMMTLFITFRLLKKKVIGLDTRLKVSAVAAAQSPCKLGVKVGDTISIRDAILAIITKSANDVAVALAEYLAGGCMPRFVALMNLEAKRLKMTSTVFKNPSGWKNPEQLTTARDMAKLSRVLITECSDYYKLFSTKRFYFRKKWYRNHNKLLGVRNGMVIDGIKTGFVTASGYNIAVSASSGGNRLIVILLGEKDTRQRDLHVLGLLKNGFLKISGAKKRPVTNILTVPKSKKIAPIRSSICDDLLEDALRAANTKNLNGITKSRLFEHVTELQQSQPNSKSGKELP